MTRPLSPQVAIPPVVKSRGTCIIAIGNTRGNVGYSMDVKVE